MLTENKTERRSHHGLQDHDSVGNRCSGVHIRIAAAGPRARRNAKTLETGTFHGKVHSTSGRATIYQEENGKLVLRLTNFKTSNRPDVHVILIAEKDEDDNANFLKSDTQRVELGKLKGKEGDQNYDLPIRSIWGSTMRSSFIASDFTPYLV